MARWPIRLSANRGEANSLRHSIWPKWVRSPSVKRYKSLATLLRLGTRKRESFSSEHYSWVWGGGVSAYRTL